MARKRWTPQTDITPSLLKLREKRKWQITLRRYVMDKTPCPPYAPYFGLDIENMRKWFEFQFKKGDSWQNHAESWQFDHIIPVTYFDFADDDELRMCWNFTNLRIAPFQKNKTQGKRLDMLTARGYFKELYEKTLYKPCLMLLKKIDKIESLETISSEAQQSFITDHRPFLDLIENYSAFEFELLNRGRSIEEINKEAEFLKKFTK